MSSSSSLMSDGRFFLNFEPLTRPVGSNIIATPAVVVK